MNETIKTILERKSVRSFSDRKIPRDILEQIAAAAIHAPTAMNRQLCRFTVVQNKKFIKQLAAVIRDELNRDNGYNFYNPDCLIISSAPEESSFAAEDCACANENMFLAAAALGIGSVWINQLKGICNAPKVRAILNELHLPENHAVFGMVALGYPAGETPEKERAEHIEWIL